MILFLDDGHVIDIGERNNDNAFEFNESKKDAYEALIALVKAKPPRMVSVGDERRAYVEIKDTVFDFGRNCVEVRLRLCWLSVGDMEGL